MTFKQPVISLHAMEFAALLVTVILIVVAIIAAMRTVYRLKSSHPLPDTKPRLAFFPKYHILRPASESPAETLKSVLQNKGFRVVTLESGKENYERGSVFGDFSIKWTKLRISESEGHPSRLVIAYGGSILFDTGDLWNLAKEIETELASTE